MTQEHSKFEQWCILELMGHRKLAGLVSEQTIAGQGFLRIDIPNGDAMTTQFYNPTSVYGMTPVTESVARELSKSWVSAPVNPWEMRKLAQLSEGESDDTGPDEDMIDDRRDGYNEDGM